MGGSSRRYRQLFSVLAPPGWGVWLIALCLLGAAHAHATVVQAPLGGQPLLLPEQLACGPAPEGWSLSQDRRSVRPPPVGQGRVGQPVELRVAPASSGCSGATETLTLLATAPFPEVEPTSVLLAAEEGRLELRGQGLAGAQLFWRARRDEHLEREVCLEAMASERAQQCVLPVRRGVPADVSLYLLPAGARFGEDVLTFDSAGRQALGPYLRTQHLPGQHWYQPVILTTLVGACG